MEKAAARKAKEAQQQAGQMMREMRLKMDANEKTIAVMKEYEVRT